MRYHVLACDYDGTIAHHGKVSAPTLDALKRLKDTGRRLMLVTGRELDDLAEHFPALDLFDQVVAENGALLYTPATHAEKPLGEPPPPEFVQALKHRNVTPLSVGRVIVATWTPQDQAVFETIHELGLELQVIFNKGAVMVLPPGVNKASGLTAALGELRLSPHNCVGVGDAENDHAFLTLCECSVAVANALPALKDRADLVTEADHGRGVTELIERLIRDDLADLGPRLARHDVQLGKDTQGKELRLRPHVESVMVAGTSGGGKSTLTTGLLERFIENGYQVCIIDPEGDYEHFEQSVTLGTSDNPPAVAEALAVLKDPRESVTLNLLAVGISERPGYLGELFPELLRLRASTGRPHWLVIDEAHHVFPADWRPTSDLVPEELHGLVLITVHPDRVAVPVLQTIDTLIAIGSDPDDTLASFSDCVGRSPPVRTDARLEAGDGLLWRVASGSDPTWFRSVPPRRQLRRHLRKYAEGKLGEDRSFYFRGPGERLNLRAANLTSFVEIGSGLDDETWLFHLRKGDYSRWMSTAIKDEELASEISEVEQSPDISADESLARIRQAIDKRYTLPA
ncbi:MAG TPA: HAD hydrolase family protein [Woeseiaceae bacterium]|nr:HAD hydrolase family protein [Woeseiaceae bacterium]